MPDWCRDGTELERTPEAPEFVFEMQVDDRDRTWIALFGYSDYEALLRLSPTGEPELERIDLGHRGIHLSSMRPRPGAGFCSFGADFDGEGAWVEQLFCHHDGELEWARELGRNGFGAFEIALDERGRVFASVSFKPTPSTPGEIDMELRAFNSDGDPLWSLRLPPEFDHAGPLDLGADGTVHVASRGYALALAAVDDSGELRWQWSEPPGEASVFAADLLVTEARVFVTTHVDVGKGGNELFAFSHDGDLLERRTIRLGDRTYGERLFASPTGEHWATLSTRSIGWPGDPQQWFALPLDGGLDAEIRPHPLEYAPGTKPWGRHLSTGDLVYTRVSVRVTASPKSFAGRDTRGSWRDPIHPRHCSRNCDSAANGASQTLARSSPRSSAVSCPSRLLPPNTS